MRVAPQMDKDKIIAVCLSGRGDKDVFSVAAALGEEDMSRIAATFAALKKANRAAFVPFVTAGDPDAETIFGDSAEACRRRRRCDRDSACRSPIRWRTARPIQASSLRALKAGMTLAKVLELVRRFRKTDNKTPIVLMGYYNPDPRLWHGALRHAMRPKPASTDCIIVDLPPEEDEVLRLPAAAHGIDIIRFVTPTTDDARLKVVLDGASGYLYYVSIAGVTGTKTYRRSRCARGAGADQARASGLPCRRRLRHQDAGAGRRRSPRIADGAVVGSAIVAQRRNRGAADGAGRAALVADVLNSCASLANSVHAAQPASVVG